MEHFGEVDPDSTCNGCGSGTPPLVRYLPRERWEDDAGELVGRVIDKVVCKDCGLIQDLDPALGQGNLFQ